MIMTLLATALVSITLAFAASWVARRGLHGDLGRCLAYQMLALAVRVAGMTVFVLALHQFAPAHLMAGVVFAVVMLVCGLALDVRAQLRILRPPTETAKDRARA